MADHSRTKSAAADILIYESETQAMAGQTAQWPGIETGGDLYGLFTRQGRPVIMLVTGPGPEALQERCHFVQDIRACAEAGAVLGEHYGLQWLGTFHSHHQLGLDSPSPGDVQQVRSVTGRNDLDRWCQIVVTHESSQGAWRHALGALLGGLRRRRADLCVRINAFLYTDPQRGVKRRATVRLLPGMSPIRSAALLAGRFETVNLCAGSFPLERILLDRADAVEPAPRQEPLPDELLAELDRLPAEVREKAEFRVGSGSVTVVLSLPGGDVAYLAMGQPGSPRVSAVLIEEQATGEVRDASAVLTDGSSGVALSEAYHLLACVAPEGPNDAADAAPAVFPGAQCPGDGVGKLSETGPAPSLPATETKPSEASQLLLSGGSGDGCETPES